MNEKSPLGFAPHIPQSELGKNLPEGALDRQKTMDAEVQKKVERAKKVAAKRKAKLPDSEEPTEFPSPDSAPDLTEGNPEPTSPILITTAKHKDIPYLAGAPCSDGAEDEVEGPYPSGRKQHCLQELELRETKYMDPEVAMKEAIKKLPVKGTLTVETKSLDMELDYLTVSISKDSVIVVMQPQPFKARLKNMETVYLHIDGEKIKCLCMLDPHELTLFPVMVLSFFRLHDFLDTKNQEPLKPPTPDISELANLGTSE